MNQDQCIEAIANYPQDITDNDTIREHLLNIWEYSQEYRKHVRMPSAYHDRMARELSVNLTKEHDALIAECERVWGEDGP